MVVFISVTVLSLFVSLTCARGYNDAANPQLVLAGPPQQRQVPLRDLSTPLDYPSAEDRADKDLSGVANMFVNREWEAVGPFPIGTREWPLRSDPVARYGDFCHLAYGNSSFPSLLGEGGQVGWSRVTTSSDGWTRLEYPQIRWTYLRQSSGWNVLQHESLLRVELNITNGRTNSEKISLAVNIVGGAEFALIRQGSRLKSASWLSGDFYSQSEASFDAERAAEQVVEVEAGSYWLVVRAVYDVRSGGDPGLDKHPTLRFRASVRLTEQDSKTEGNSNDLLEILPGLSLVPDYLITNGKTQLTGNYISLVVKNWSDKWLTVNDVRLEFGPEQTATLILVDLLDSGVRVAPGQTRSLSISMRITDSYELPVGTDIITTTFAVDFLTGNRRHTATKILRLSRAPFEGPFRFTFRDSDDSVQYAMALPPLSPPPTNQSSPIPIILALHGAGVEASSPFWTSSIPRQSCGVWIVLPTGRTPWGYDWHGPSLWNAANAVEEVPRLHELWFGNSDFSAIPDVNRLIIMGHSNGGQGAWYFMSHFPDRVLGGVPASGYVKIQDYVSYTGWGSGHFQDPSLLAVLSSGLKTFDNDLHASNLVFLPLLVRHGSADDNVPAHHSRVMAATVDWWSRSSTATFLSEVPAAPHWFDEVFASPEVESFLDNLIRPARSIFAPPLTYPIEFTLSVVNPDESGSKFGLRILEVEIPGRLSRLRVLITANMIHIRTKNAKEIGMKPENLALTGCGWNKVPNILIDDQRVSSASFIDLATPKSVTFQKSAGGWVSLDSSIQADPRRRRHHGPIFQILTSAGPIRIVCGTLDPSAKAESFALAQKFARDAFLLGRIDVEILTDRDASSRLGHRPKSERGNLVLLGGPFENSFYPISMQDSNVPVRFLAPDAFYLQETIFNGPGHGIIFLAEHPFHADDTMLVIAGTDRLGIRTAARLFPQLTGVTAPDWVVTGSDKGHEIMAAGFWSAAWSWSEAMSYLE